MPYQRTQHGPWGWVLLLVGLFQMGVGIGLADGAEAGVGWLLIGVGSILIAAAACFSTLTISGEPDGLVVSFGPFPLISFRIPLDQIRSCGQERSRWIDGWGIHWAPGRGWLYNVWGYDCIRLDLEGRSVRLGTGDPAGLMAWLAERGIPSRERR